MKFLNFLIAAVVLTLSAASTFHVVSAFRFQHPNQQQQQQRELVHAWNVPVGSTNLIDRATKADNGESILLFNQDNRLIRIGASKGTILFNVSVPPIANTQTVQWSTSFFEETSTITGTSYIAIQRASTVAIYAFAADHSAPAAPVPVLELNWPFDMYNQSANVILTNEDIIVVPWLEQAGSSSYQLRAFDINPATKPADRARPLYSVKIENLDMGQLYYAGGVVAVNQFTFISTTQGFDAKTGKLLWTVDFGSGVDYTGVFPARETGFFFYYKNDKMLVLNALNARTGKVAFAFSPPDVVTGVEDIPGNPRIVRIIAANSLVLLDTLTGKSIKQFVMTSNGGNYQILANGTRALVFHSYGNNSLWDLTTDAQLGKEIQWYCYRKNMPPEEICDRPLVSSGVVGVLASTGEEVVFTMYNPWQSGYGYIPTALNGYTGATIASTTSDQALWDFAPDVLAFSSNSGVAVYFGSLQAGGQSAVGYRLQ